MIQANNEEWEVFFTDVCGILSLMPSNSQFFFLFEMVLNELDKFQILRQSLVKDFGSFSKGGAGGLLNFGRPDLANKRRILMRQKYTQAPQLQIFFCGNCEELWRMTELAKRRWHRLWKGGTPPSFEQQHELVPMIFGQPAFLFAVPP